MNVQIVSNIALLYNEPMEYTKDECDLWSFGCTIFECATGRLPFMPEGGVEDHQGMVDMIKSKPLDAISGEWTNAGCEWETELPQDRCSYPKSLQRILSGFLRRIFHRSEKSCLTFEKFSQMCAELSSLKTFRLFNVNKLWLEDYFDSSSSFFFERVPFENDVLDDLPQHSLACVLALPSRAVANLTKEFDRSILDKASDVVVIAFKGEDEASYTVPIVKPAPAASAVPEHDDLRESTYGGLSSLPSVYSSLRLATANVLRIEKQIEALWRFVEGTSAFCCTFSEILGKDIDIFAAEVNLSRRIVDGVRFQTAALSLGGPVKDTNFAESPTKHLTAEMSKNEYEAKELTNTMVKVIEAMQKIAATRLPKFVSQRKVLKIIIKNWRSECAKEEPPTEFLKALNKADCNMIIKSVENAIKNHEENSNDIRGIVSLSFSGIFRKLFDTSNEFSKAKVRLDETLKLITAIEKANQRRLVKLQKDENVFSVGRYAEIIAASLSRELQNNEHADICVYENVVTNSAR